MRQRGGIRTDLHEETHCRNEIPIERSNRDLNKLDEEPPADELHRGKVEVGKFINFGLPITLNLVFLICQSSIGLFKKDWISFNSQPRDSRGKVVA
mgnify:CR=1 FL=1